MANPSPQREESSKRETEPMPSNCRPALRFVGFLFLVTAAIATAAAVVDRMIYG